MRKKKFKAESQRLLDLMINSIYTHKEIFLREILSNASDAIDKLCYLSLTDDQVGLDRGDFAIRIKADETARTLTVSDNGIGMSEEELEENLGVIANSGSLQFRRETEGSAEKDTDIIGQFGVGFYSAFMVADRVTVITRKYGEEQGYRWESAGAEGYTVEPCDKERVGTDVIMHIKSDEDEPDEYSRYLRPYELRELVKKYSDYIRFPIRMDMPHSRRKEGSPDDKPEYEEVMEEETLNSMVPLWQRKKSEVTKEEYEEFYRQRFGEFSPSQSVITVSAEGAVTYKALLFIPSRRPGLYGTEDFQPGLQLYSAGVMIMDKCADLLPEPFNFVRGVVDSPDLSLNISRELLQHDRQLKIISGNLEKKIKAELERMLRDEREEYEKFWQNFGLQLKVSAINNYGARKEQLQDLLLFYSSKEKKLVTLSEYVSRMPENQKYIYYAAGDTVDAVDHMPQTERLKDHDMEILYFVDRPDDFLADVFGAYQDKPFRSATDGDLELEDEVKHEETPSQQEALAFVKETLGEKVTEVKASARLKTHPVCLSSGEGLTFEMEKYFAAVQPEMGMKAKRILEINVDHPAFAALETARITDPERAKKYAQVLYNQALLIAGLPLEDPGSYTDLLCSLWQ
ncbi:MAG: molecular chaperone HtpG [Oscillospiraceae bacterium]|nr:molecular chaperone HtpG [Oscillospiraceae bacterium]